jgi:hypothetical protein
MIIFNRVLCPVELSGVEIRIANSNEILARGGKIKLDRYPTLRIFVLGSPRSGTSELGDTLATQLQLPWLGEGHAAPLFAKAAEALAGNESSGHGLVRFIAQNNLRQLVIQAARTAYFVMHGSASFIDKTPGHPMIAAAPLLKECFPGAKFIFLRRNGISNVLSRMKKFGGNFDAHCSDWAAAMMEWKRVEPVLGDSLEVEQEHMLEDPNRVAREVAGYLGLPQKAEAIGNSLRSGARERTGAGLGRKSFPQTGWSIRDIDRFRELCGPAMEVFGYKIE